MMGTYYGMGLFGGGLMMLLFWGAIIWLIVLLVKDKSACTHNEASRPVKSSALDILNERYAKGEINKQEFEEKKKDLTQSGS